jgi:tripartite-type tricarboxylate transporter receptor subunit TctC
MIRDERSCEVRSDLRNIEGRNQLRRKKEMRKKTIVFVLALLIGLAWYPGIIQSQSIKDYPAKPVTLIVPFAAGGGTDIGTRIVAKYAEKHLGKPLVIKNVEGGGSEVGVSQMIRSKPDGYTIGGYNSASVILTTMRKASYHPVNDIEPICLVVSDPRLFAVRADDNRFKEPKDFINFARQNPGKLTIGTSGAGTSGHLSILALNKAANAEAKPVHFGGAGLSKAAFLGGHIVAIAQTYGEVLQMIKEKKARVMAIAMEERLQELPDVPTFKEIGIDLVISSNRGFAAPKGTPKEIINKLADAFKKASAEKEYLKEMENMGLPVKFLGSAEFGMLNKQEYELYSVLSKELTQK